MYLNVTMYFRNLITASHIRCRCKAEANSTMPSSSIESNQMSLSEICRIRDMVGGWPPSISARIEFRCQGEETEEEEDEDTSDGTKDDNVINDGDSPTMDTTRITALMKRYTRCDLKPAKGWHAGLASDRCSSRQGNQTQIWPNSKPATLNLSTSAPFKQRIPILRKDFIMVSRR
jgi:hypothetical protein